MRRPRNAGSTDVGNIAETVRVRGFLDILFLNNPSRREAREHAAGLGHENGPVARGLGKHPGKVSVGGLLAGQPGIMEAALDVVQFGDRRAKSGLVRSLGKPDA